MLPSPFLTVEIGATLCAPGNAALLWLTRADRHRANRRLVAARSETRRPIAGHGDGLPGRRHVTICRAVRWRRDRFAADAPFRVTRLRRDSLSPAASWTPGAGRTPSTPRDEFWSSSASTWISAQGLPRRRLRSAHRSDGPGRLSSSAGQNQAAALIDSSVNSAIVSSSLRASRSRPTKRYTVTVTMAIVASDQSSNSSEGRFRSGKTARITLPVVLLIQ